jgi:hypothetical protein
MKRHILPALLLFCLAPCCAELLSGSTPLMQMLNPVSFLLDFGLYGGGVLLFREILIRWKKGFLGVLFLGMAYGIIEEGIALMSFYNPQWSGMGADANYGWWGGVGWVWVTHLVIYHVVFSTAIPIVLAHLVFPEVRSEPWLGRGGLALTGIIYLCAILASNLFVRFALHFSPPILPYLATWMAVIFMLLSAYWIRPLLPMPTLESKSLPHPIFYFLAAFLLTVALFFCGWVLPSANITPAILTALSMLCLASVGTAWIGNSVQHGAVFTDARKFMTAAGGLFFLILITFIEEARGVDAQSGNSFRGQALVGFFASLLLVILGIAIYRRRRTAKG